MARIQMTAVLLLIPVWLVASGCGGSSSALPTPPTPTPSQPPPASSVSISSISPSSTTAGSPDTTLTITGSGFVHQGRNVSIAIWSDPHSCCGGPTFLNTTFVSSTELTAIVRADLLQSTVTAQLFVENGDPMGISDGVVYPTSNSVSFTVNAPAPAVSPSAVVLGTKSSQEFVAMMNGKSAGATWAVEEGSAGGTITAAGLYTAPDQLGTFHVVATFVADSLKSATAEINIVGSGFATTGSMHSARSGHTATLLKDGRVLIVGGGDGTAELFDPTNGDFSVTGSPVTGRLDATATLLADGKVLIAGGLGVAAGPDGHLPRLNNAEIFDPATGTFSATGSMIQARWRHTATLLSDGRVLVAGGFFDAICTTASAELFDPATGTFSSAGFMLTERVHHTATLLDSGEVLMAGGSNGCAPDAADDPPWDPLFVELYEPTSGNFQDGGSMSTTRIGHAAIHLPDGRVLLLGGIPALQNLHEQPPNPSYAEEYDPAAHAISPVAGLTISRAKYTATLLTSGTILIAGGVDEQGHPTSEAGLVNPATGTLTNTGGLVTARVGHTATLLNDGRVLVTGGSDINGNDTATAEVYK